MRGLEPFIAADENRLGEVERGVGRARRKGDDRVGERDFVIVQPGALRPEQDSALLAAAAAVAPIAALGVKTAFIWPRSRAVVA